MLPALLSSSIVILGTSKRWFHYGFNAMVRTFCSVFLAVVSGIHWCCGLCLDRNVTWKTLFSYTESHDNGVDIVIRVETSFGFNERVQGNVVVQQFGSHRLYRLLLSGHFPPVDHNGEHVLIPGDSFVGAIYLPDGLVWNIHHKKVKSNNTSSVRGQSTLIKFPPNVTGTTSIQITFIYNSGNDEAKDISERFRGVINAIKWNVDY
jgi:hypothetical protein